MLIPSRRLSVAYPLIALAAASLAMLAVSLFGFMETERQLTQARLSKALAVARAVQSDVDRALGVGIPLEKIEGAAVYLEGLAARNPDLRFFAVSTGSGRLLYYAGIGRARLTPILQQVRDHAARSEPVSAEGFIIQHLPLRGGVGVLSVGVQPSQIREQLTAEVPRGLAFGAAVLLLVHELVVAAAHAAFTAPLGRLRDALAGAAGGRFDTLLARRPRDGIGRAMLAYNAAVFRVHALRQGFTAHVEEVRTAVFDPEVAREVVVTRDRTLAALGDGGEPPAPSAAPGPGHSGAFAAFLLAAAGCVVVGSAAVGNDVAALAGPLGLVALAAFAAGALAGRLLAGRLLAGARAAGPTVARLIAAALAAVVVAAGVEAAMPALVAAGLAAALGGAGASLAMRNAAHRVAGAAGALKGVAAGGLFGFVLSADPSAASAVAVTLALAALVAAGSLRGGEA